MVTAVDHLCAKLDPMALGFSMEQSAGDLGAVMQHRAILSLQELPNSEAGSINRCQHIKKLLCISFC